MIELYFGLPRTGKTTLFASFALKASQGLFRGKKYDYVYTNVLMSGMPDNVRYLSPDALGVVDVSNSLILVDEGSIFFDNRDYKKLSKSFREFLYLYGHYNCDIIIATQQYNAVDVKIRLMCTGVYYMWRPLLIGHWITRYYRVPYGIAFPDPKTLKKTSGVPYGDIVEGYCRPNILQRIFAHSLYRPKYYKYFDTYAAPKLQPYDDYLKGTI